MLPWVDVKISLQGGLKGGHMNIYKLSGRNIEVTDALRNHVGKKLERLDRYFDHIVDARVTLSIATSPHVENRAKAEVQVNVPGGLVRAEEDDPDMYTAIDRAADVLEKQLRRFKGRLLARRTSTGGKQQLEQLPDHTDEVEDFEPQIVRTKSFEMKPMTPEDAAYEMEAVGHNFYAFRNSSSGRFNVIYRRRDGNYGLIEPNS